MLAPALLSLPLDMHLTRVSGASAQETSQAIATGGDGDLLALLLGGAGEASPAFPLTLEAALAGGAAIGDPPAEASDDTPAEATDAAAVSIDAAIAAALALGAAVVSDPTAVPAEGGAAEATDVVATGEAIAASVAVRDAAGSALVAPTRGADATATSAADPTGAIDAAVESAPAAPPSDEHAEAAEAGKAAVPDPSSRHTATSADATVTAPAHEREARPVGTSERSTHDAGGAREVASDVVTPGRPADDADAPPSFEHHDDGDGQLGGSARSTATTTVETTAEPTLTVTAPGAAGEPTHVTHGDAVDPATTPSVQTTTNGGTTASHANAPARVENAPLAHGTIEARWSERVGDAVRLSALRGGGEIRLQLEPEGLGHIDVRLDLHADGVRAVIVAEHESTRALLQSQQQALHDAFGRSDLRLSGFSVDVGSGGAAAFQRGTDGGEGGQAPAAAASASPTTTTSTDAAEASSFPAGNGRVNVRV